MIHFECRGPRNIALFQFRVFRGISEDSWWQLCLAETEEWYLAVYYLSAFYDFQFPVSLFLLLFLWDKWSRFYMLEGPSEEIHEIRTKKLTWFVLMHCACIFPQGPRQPLQDITIPGYHRLNTANTSEISCMWWSCYKLDVFEKV